MANISITLSNDAAYWLKNDSIPHLRSCRKYRSPMNEAMGNSRQMQNTSSGICTCGCDELIAILKTAGIR